MVWALALSMTISSSPSRLSSLSSRRFPMNLATRQYMEFSGTILISSGKWYPYHSLRGQGHSHCSHPDLSTALCVPRPPHHSQLSPQVRAMALWPGHWPLGSCCTSPVCTGGWSSDSCLW